MDRAALGPAYHGEDAAALAALHNYLAVAKEPPRLTRDWFAAYRPVRYVAPQGATPMELKAARRAYNATPGSLQNVYALGLRRQRGGGSVALFGMEGPTLSDIRQGALGDCYMLAPLGAYVHRDPEALRRMVKPDDRGGYAVEFGDGKTVRVSGPSDAEIAMGGSSTKDGLWVRVVEKAFGSRDFGAEGDGSKVARDGLNGGSPARADAGLTGHRFSSVKLVGGDQRTVAEPDLVPKLENLRRVPSKALAGSRLVLASTGKEEMPKSVNGHHAYAVFGCDARTDATILWNPHGNDFEPKGPEGYEDGFRRQNGVFSMPLPLFARAFSRIYYEGDAPVLNN